MPLRLYNTLTKRIEEFRPADYALVTFYTCGPTVYDDAHIGNFRSFLAADLLRRFIESPLCELAGDPRPPEFRGAGRRVVHVINITDVGHMTDDAEGGEGGEDRMAVAGRRLAEAKKTGTLPAGVDLDPADPHQIARFYEGRFREDARLLGLKAVLEADADPTLTPRATAHVEGMQTVIARLIDRGNAYVTGAPGSRAVYFRVRSFAGYGALSGNTLERLRAGSGGRVSDEHQSAKEHPADFLLWKEDQRHLMRWPSPWGEGYPGWHIECSAMSAARLAGGRGADLSRLEVPGHEPLIDLHSGGEDNIFPHHECEIAQTCCAFNQRPEGGTYARLWFHPRHLFVNGEKMSKSRGNFYTVRDLTSRGAEAGAIRLGLMATHYRSNADFTDQGLRDSGRTLERWRRVSDAVADAGDPGSGVAMPEHPVLRAFADALHEDLNIAGAVAAVNSWVGSISTPAPEDVRVMRAIDAVLGVLERPRAASASTEIGVFVGGLAPDQRVVDLLRQRAAARAGRDFARSDAIRDELLAMGYAIKDVAGGKVEVGRRA